MNITIFWSLLSY